MLCYSAFLAVLIASIHQATSEKLNLETLNNYSEFLNFGEKKLVKLKKEQLENSVIKSKVDVLGEIFKKNIDIFKVSTKLDLIFLIDGSSSVGEANFRSELKFVKKLLSDVTVDYDHTRVAIVTFSSSASQDIDEISQPKKENNKCFLLNRQLNKIEYTGGGTNTLGAFQLAKEIFKNSRNESKKILFLITDGFSNGGDPVPLANELKKDQITIFTIGIQNGNYKELYDLSSTPGEFYSYLLDSFQQFESLARRALHVDLKSGDYIPLGINSPCDVLCEEGDCCDKKALCTCGTSTGHYSCICQPGYYGSGLKNTCLPCPSGSYSNGPNLCLPCPDLHHTTKPPAHSIDSCKCKPGYQDTEDNHCEILKCAKISVPEHGYFVKKRDCGNVLNTACGVRCEVGYTLVGSSIRLCQANATWSGDEPSCQVKTCTRLTPPAYGSMVCSHADLGVTYNETELNLPVDTVCTFECEDGKTLIGSSQRTCLPISRWDGLKTTCKQIKCPKLPPVKNGKIEPRSCSISKQSYGKKCKIICDAGFEIEGPPEKTCTGNHGLWDSKFDDTTCKDATPPSIICPNNITSVTQVGKKFGTVSLPRPEVTDNSDLELSIWMKPSMKNITGFKFQIGKTQVTYFAQDSFHNRAKCTFFVTINDTEKPIIEDCINPPTFLTSEKGGANITWDEPNILDNSHNVTVKRSRDFGFFPIGTTTVNYTATDGSGNENFCTLNITVEDAHCQALPDPVYGRSECVPGNDGMQCVITCLEGYAIPISQPPSNDNSSVSFLCNDAESIWYNQEGLTFPECSVTEVPTEIEQNGTVSIKSDLESCNNTEKLNDLENDVKITLQEVSCEDNCTVKTDTVCEEFGEDDDEEKTNIIKREVAFEEVPHKNTSRRRGKKKRVNVKFQVKGKYVTANQQLGNIALGPHNLTILFQKSAFVCPTGFVPRKNRCVQCPRGTFHNVTKNKCNSCAVGFFNDQLGQTKCKSCPIHFSTKRTRSKKIDDCKEQCPPGTHARRKIIKQSKRYSNTTLERITLKPQCRSCLAGHYQPDYGQLTCLPCPAGYTTAASRAVSVNQCIPTAAEICAKIPNICNNGKCVVNNDFVYTCDCPEGYIGTHCEKVVSPCDSAPCLNEGSCKPMGNSSDFICLCPKGFTGKYCQDSEEKCLLICLNNGTCLQNDVNDYFCLCPPGFGGDTCEIKLTYCHNDICENNGSCVENYSGFRCECSGGFIGRRCTLLPCDYKPCRGNSICVNTMEDKSTKASYSCTCPDGYTGELCDQKIDYCQKSPCLNGGRCSSNSTSYTCECSRLYYGNTCELKKRSNYILNFRKMSTTDYIKLDGLKNNNLTAVTACLWMQTRDNFNYGTLISYATKNYDNAFTLTDYTGLVLYINNHYAVTDVLLNDGLWHHVCVSWQSLNGVYKLHVDGKMAKSGTGLATNTRIEGDGNMVIGQEQDILGGRFSQSETFIGKMAHIDVWSKELVLDEITQHLNDCQDSFLGDIYSWPEIQHNVHGSVAIENSTFCSPCEPPKPLYNGLINIINNVAYYECYKGFYLSSMAFSKGRRCNKAAKWEGQYEPYCKKIYCGYPGYVRNGYTIGAKYYYMEKIGYECYEGYNLIGSSVITCTENGTWYPEKPHCSGLQCTAFRKPDYSNLTVIAEHSYEDFIESRSTFDIGTQVEVVCDERANLTGENIITCTENGTWDFEPPFCVMEKPAPSRISCDIDKIPPPPTNGYIVAESLYAVGNGTEDTVEYMCRNGHKLHGDNFTTCIIDGYWTEPNISCDPILCSTPKYKNMQLKDDVGIGGAFYFGNMIKFNCVEGYRLFGDATVRCLANGRWTRMKGKCSKISCRKPNVKETTIIKGDSYLYEDTVILTCSNQNQYTLTCNSFGMWIGDKDESC